jgi:amino acid transporter
MEVSVSISTIVALGVERQLQRKLSRRGGGDDIESGKRAVQSAMERVAAFIPSEVIGIYVAGFGILSPQTDAEKWVVFGISLALIPVLMGLNYVQQKKHTGADVDVRIMSILLIFAITAFIAWAAAMPGTPFLSVTPRATAVGGWAVVILAIVMHRVAELLDVIPRSH